MKKIILSAMLVAITAMGFSVTITVHNPYYLCGGCSYDIKLSSITFHKAGDPDYGISERAYHTITSGSSYTWTLSAPAGYTIDWSSLSMQVKYCSGTVTVGNATAFNTYNNCSCSTSYYVTVWNRNSDGDYNLYCDMVVGPSGMATETMEKAESEAQEKIELTGETEKAVLETSAAIMPNPSTGIFTITTGNDLPESTYNVTVTDATGREVYTKSNASSGSPLQIDLTALPKGIYLLNLVSGDKKLSHRLMKE